MRIRNAGIGVVCTLLSALLVEPVLDSGEARAQEPKLVMRPPTPTLVGPDAVERAPVLVLSENRTELDGRAMTPEELQEALGTLVKTYKLLQPDVPFNGKLIVACDPKTTSGRLTHHLKVALLAGFPNPVFLFIRPAPTADRSADRITGALTTTFRAETATKSNGGSVLKVRDYSNCLLLSRAVIAQRNRKTRVLLDLERPASGQR